MDVAVWLRSLGLGKYEAAFRDNEIDETVLPSLTHENLKELGVTALGHRLKLLDAIAALRSDASGKAPPADAVPTLSAPNAPPEDRAERRQVTVMFSDLVGSTALSARMDPEDLREVIPPTRSASPREQHRATVVYAMTARAIMPGVTTRRATGTSRATASNNGRGDRSRGRRTARTTTDRRRTPFRKWLSRPRQ